jgi:hypothetical protein
VTTRPTVTTCTTLIMHFRPIMRTGPITADCRDRTGLHDQREGAGGADGVVDFFGLRGSRRGLSLGTGSSFGIGDPDATKGIHSIVGLLGRAPAATGEHLVCG